LSITHYLGLSLLCLLHVEPCHAARNNASFCVMCFHPSFSSALFCFTKFVF
jgi:hypothetical protein